MRPLLLIIILTMALIAPAIKLSAERFNLANDARAAWDNYIQESFRDQKTKEFIEIRIVPFIDNLTLLEEQVAITEKPAVSLEVAETFSRLKRDFIMLDSTIRNLRQLDTRKESSRVRDADLALLTSLGSIYGRATTVAGKNQ